MLGRQPYENSTLLPQQQIERPLYDSHFNNINKNYQDNFDENNNKYQQNNYNNQQNKHTSTLITTPVYQMGSTIMPTTHSRRLKNLEFEQSLMREVEGRDVQQELKDAEIQRKTLQEKNGDYFEEHFEDSEDSRIHINEREQDDVNIIIRQTQRPLQQQQQQQEYKQQEQQEYKQQQQQQPVMNLTTSVMQQKIDEKKEKEVKIGELDLDDRPEHGIQIIKVEESGELSVNDELLTTLNKYKDYKLGFACLAGQYRTGKSFLLNQLLNIKGKGFKVDNSTTACTQGLWMWSRPLVETTSNTCVFFLDSEGANSLEKDSKHDAKVFALSLLLSSLFMFNTVGCIDERAIDQLKLTASLSNNIQLAQHQSISQHAPKFLWILRDFVLEMKDSQGRTIDSRSYMEHCLGDDTNLAKSSQQNKAIRESILGVFRDRDCIALVRPVVDEGDLQQLEHLPSHRLRKEFSEQVKRLKQKIMQGCLAKQVEGVYLAPHMFYSLAIGYVQCINQGGMPNIPSAWQYMQQEQCANLFHQAQAIHSQAIQSALSSQQVIGQNTLHNICCQYRQAALTHYLSSALQHALHTSTHYNHYLEQLNTHFDQNEKQLIQLNQQLSTKLCEELLAFASKDVTNNLNNNKYKKENIDKFYKDMNEFLNIYNLKSEGSQQLEVLIKFLQNFTPFSYKTILQNISGDSNNNNDQQLQQLQQQLQDYKRDNQIIKQQNEIYQQQLEEQQLQISQSKNNEDTTQIKKQLQIQQQRNVSHEQKILDLSEQLKIQEQNSKQKDQQIEHMKKNQKACCTIY